MESKRMTLAMVAMTVLTAEAFPRMTATRMCHISQYKTLIPSDLRAVQKLRDKYEETMLPIIQKCSKKLLNLRPTVFHFMVHDRLIIVEKKVTLAIHILRNISNPELSTYASKPLDLLVSIRENLRHCVNSRTHRNHHSQHLDHWLKEFNKDKEMESQQCLEEIVILNLFRLLNEDVKCAAYMEVCNKLVQHLSPLQGITTAN
ncbi:interferon lambda-3-like [Lissotriton helveticus]